MQIEWIKTHRKSPLCPQPPKLPLVFLNKVIEGCGAYVAVREAGDDAAHC